MRRNQRCLLQGRGESAIDREALSPEGLERPSRQSAGGFDVRLEELAGLAGKWASAREHVLIRFTHCFMTLCCVCRPFIRRTSQSHGARRGHQSPGLTGGDITPCWHGNSNRGYEKLHVRSTMPGQRARRLSNDASKTAVALVGAGRLVDAARSVPHSGAEISGPWNSGECVLVGASIRIHPVLPTDWFNPANRWRQRFGETFRF